MTLILGTSKSLFLRIRSGTDDPSTLEIEFPLCNENGGLKESWEWKSIQHELLSYKLSQKHHGYRIVWDFYFDDWADGETLMKFKQIKNSLDAGGTWNLRPRNEEQYLSRVFDVVCTSDNFDVVLDSGGMWHTGFHMQFKSRYLVDSIDWTTALPVGDPIYYAIEIDNVALNS